MDIFFQNLLVRAATIDEILSDNFEVLPGQKSGAELAARRLVAWCRACASGDWSLFGRRLERDGLSIVEVLARFAGVRRSKLAPPPIWIEDAIWIESELKSSAAYEPLEHSEPCAFERLLLPVVKKAEALLWSGVDERLLNEFNQLVRSSLSHRLLKQLSNLCAPAIYERFDKSRNARAYPQSDISHFDQFVTEMKGGGFRSLFEEKPVLLRLIATITRQWLDTTREFVLRLDADLATLRQHTPSCGRIVQITGDLSDPHNAGRSVQIIRFEDGTGIVYKPKDQRLDVAWYNLVERLNRSGPPIELRSAQIIPREGYAWAELIEHTGCADLDGCKRFFRRAGAWLALFHCFAAIDMHQENMIAAGDHPVPIDLEMILQAAEEQKAEYSEGLAYQAAVDLIHNTVLMVGLIPAHFRSPDHKVFTVGGLAGEWTYNKELTWNDINSDHMRPTRSEVISKNNFNLPHVAGCYAKFSDHVDDFISGFEDYARFLQHLTKAQPGALFEDFANLPARRVIRPTRFYYMLLRRLTNHRTMDDGVVWSAQADFLARLTNWENNGDPLWLLQRSERTALLVLNIPHFVVPTDGLDVRDATGIVARMQVAAGMDRARAVVRILNEQHIAWQTEVIKGNTNSLLKSTQTEVTGSRLKDEQCSGVLAEAQAMEIFVREAEKIEQEISSYAIRRGRSAAWIGFDWLGDGEVAQLTCLGPDLYNGACGIALFLAAHAAVTDSGRSHEMALAAILYLRRTLKGRNGPRLARLLGIGGAMGLGSIVYALTVISNCLRDVALLSDANVAAELINEDLITEDKQLDVLGGSAGAILGLLRLYRETGSKEALDRAIRCGEHLLAQPRNGHVGQRSWVAQGSGSKALNGMSHGAAGFAYALASLAAATAREDFFEAAAECIAFENSSYDAERYNWPTWPIGGETRWICRWCHGAAGIGLARIGMRKWTNRKLVAESAALNADIRNAAEGLRRCWPGHADTLCCGTLGAVEFLCEAGVTLGQKGLRELAFQQLVAVVERAASRGDYQWNVGERRYNLGLFRGLAGTGYTLLRRAESSLPNILLWE